MNESERIDKIADLSIRAGVAHQKLRTIRALTKRHPVAVPTGELTAALDGNKTEETEQ